MTDIVAPPPASPPPVLREIGYSDIKAALAAGWRDFKAAPVYGLFFGGMFVLGGLAIMTLLSFFNAPWMIIPIAIGFPLVAPFVAAGLYEVSRRLDAGEPLNWGAILGFMASQRRREFSWMAFIVLFVFWIWMYQVRLITVLFLDGDAFGSIGGFFSTVFTTGTGITYLLVGSCVGAVLALVMFSLTVIGMPLLVEREHDIVTALATSVHAVIKNFGPMVLWGLIAAGLTVLGMLPMFLGLFVVLPVLGHGTWHLFRHTVEPLPAGA